MSCSWASASKVRTHPHLHGTTPHLARPGPACMMQRNLFSTAHRSIFVAAVTCASTLRVNCAALLSCSLLQSTLTAGLGLVLRRRVCAVHDISVPPPFMTLKLRITGSTVQLCAQMHAHQHANAVRRLSVSQLQRMWTAFSAWCRVMRITGMTAFGAAAPAAASMHVSMQELLSRSLALPFSTAPGAAKWSGSGWLLRLPSDIVAALRPAGSVRHRRMSALQQLEAAMHALWYHQAVGQFLRALQIYVYLRYCCSMVHATACICLRLQVVQAYMLGACSKEHMVCACMAGQQVAVAVPDGYRCT